MDSDGVTEVPGAPGWRYGAFERDERDESFRVPLIRAEDGKETGFTLPDFVNDADEIARVAHVVIAAVERWKRVEGLGA